MRHRVVRRTRSGEASRTGPASTNAASLTRAASNARQASAGLPASPNTLSAQPAFCYCTLADPRLGLLHAEAAITWMMYQGPSRGCAQADALMACLHSQQASGTDKPHTRSIIGN